MSTNPQFVSVPGVILTNVGGCEKGRFAGDRVSGTFAAWCRRRDSAADSNLESLETTHSCHQCAGTVR